ncbi:sporulation integral membrane protein YtvI [Bacillus sp. FSL W7-1360]
MTNFMSKRMVKIVLVIVLLVVACFLILPISLPLIAAYLTALLLLPGVKLLHQRLKVSYSISVLLVFGIFIFLLAIGTYFLTTTVVTQGTRLVENLPHYIREINQGWLNFQHDLRANDSIPTEFVQALNQEVTQVLNNLGAYVNDLNLIARVATVVSSIPGYLVSFLVYLIGLFLFLLEMPKLKVLFYGMLTERSREKVSFMFTRLSHVILGFLKAQFLVSIPIFLVSFLFLLWAAPEVALLAALLIWVIDLIPIIGSIIVLAPWGIVQLLTGDVGMATKLFILAAVLLIIRRTLEPKVMSIHIGLSPLATLISMYLGLMLFGVLGFVVGPLIMIGFISAKEAGIIKFNFKI